MNYKEGLYEHDEVMMMNKEEAKPSDGRTEQRENKCLYCIYSVSPSTSPPRKSVSMSNGQKRPPFPPMTSLINTSQDFQSYIDYPHYSKGIIIILPPSPPSLVYSSEAIGPIHILRHYTLSHFFLHFPLNNTSNSSRNH